MTTQSIYHALRDQLFACYRTRLEFQDRILGGIPRDPKLIEAWLRKGTGVTNDEEIRAMMVRTLIESGVEVTEGTSYEDMVAAAEKVAAVKQSMGFKRDENGLFIEDRQVKAGIKEAVNILFAGPDSASRWGVTKKGPRAFTAERVFVSPLRIYLQRDGQRLQQPDGMAMQTIHAETPKGPVNSLLYAEYCENAVIEFDVQVLLDEVRPGDWPKIWMLMELNGIGASRSQSFGKFNVTGFSRQPRPKNAETREWWKKAQKEEATVGP